MVYEEEELIRERPKRQYLISTEITREVAFPEALSSGQIIARMALKEWKKEEKI